MAGFKDLKNKIEEEAAALPRVLAEEGRSAIFRMHAIFARNVPMQARQTGAFAPPDDHPLGEPQPSVPDGSYRVLGSQWVLDFVDGRITQVYEGTRAQPGEIVELSHG